MFENECLGILEYEGTASAILMAGLFLSFSVDYAGQRFAQWHSAKKAASVEGTSLGLATRSAELVNVAMLEAGIVFHSLCECFMFPYVTCITFPAFCYVCILSRGEI